MPRQRREFKIYNENIDRTFTQHQTKIQQLDDSITLQATSITTVSGRVDTLDGNVSTLSGNVSTLSGNVSTLSGNVNTLSGDVSDLSDDLSDLDTQVQTNEARMIIESNGILSTVTSAIGADTVISTVNQTAGQYIIDSNKIDLRGVVTFSDLSTNGNTTITGNNITTGIIKDTNNNVNINLSTGAVTIKSGSITLGSTSGSYFNVTSSGAMTAYNATIKGTLTSQNGNYNTTVSNGFVNFYIGSTYVGKVGGSTFYDQESGFDYYGSMLDVGLDAKYGGIAVQENSGEAAKLALYYDRNSNAFRVKKKTYFTSFIDATGRIYTDDGFTGGSYLYVSNSSGTVGINHDQYGVALYNNSSHNNYIRVGADRVDVAVSGGFYVNGTRLA